MYWWFHRQAQGKVWRSTSLPFVLDFYKDGEQDPVTQFALLFSLWFHQRGESRCIRSRNFQDRKQRSFREKIQPRAYESRGAIWQSSFQYISAIKSSKVRPYSSMRFTVCGEMVSVFYATFSFGPLTLSVSLIYTAQRSFKVHFNNDYND